MPLTCVGLSDVVDSLLAIRQLVYQERAVSFADPDLTKKNLAWYDEAR